MYLAYFIGGASCFAALANLFQRFGLDRPDLSHMQKPTSTSCTGTGTGDCESVYFACPDVIAYRVRVIALKKLKL